MSNAPNSNPTEGQQEMRDVASVPHEGILHTSNGVVDEEKPRLYDEKKHQSVQYAPVDDSSDGSIQLGVQEVEALAAVWSKSHLIAAYIIVWFITFVDALQQSMTSALDPYVTSSFQAHSLTAVTSIISSLIGGIARIPLAKIFDLWGRPAGFTLVVLFFTVGLAMMAGCNNVKTYAAAQVFHMVGHNGLSYFVQVFVADTAALKDRAFINALVMTPFIISAWIAGPIATAFYKHSTWRWGFGAFTIIVPVTCAPLFLFYWIDGRAAKKAGLIRHRKSQRTVFQSIKHYLIEFDAAGLLLLCAGLSLFLLPFSIYSYQKDGWRSPLIICLIIFGGLLLVAFAIWEKFLAPKCFMPYELLVDRTVLGACLLAASSQVTYYLWQSYFSSFLQVVTNLSLTDASYVGNVYMVGMSIFDIPAGWAIRWTGRFKWVALYCGIPFEILGVGLMIYFRQPGVNIGYVVMCQIFIAFAAGVDMMAERVAVMAAVSHQYVAAGLAIQGMANNIGQSIGSTASAAIWSSVFPSKLAEYFPNAGQGELDKIYGSLDVQQRYRVGTPERLAIDRAYGDAQKYMAIAGTAVLAISVASIVMWRDIRIKDVDGRKTGAS